MDEQNQNILLNNILSIVGDQIENINETPEEISTRIMNMVNKENQEYSSKLSTLHTKYAKDPMNIDIKGMMDEMSRINDLHQQKIEELRKEADELLSNKHNIHLQF